MMLLCLAVAAEEKKLDKQATETRAEGESEDSALCTQISGLREKSPASLCSNT